MGGAIALLLLALAPAGAEVTGDNWPGFRGDGSGISAARDLPLHWSGTENVLWKSEVPGEGYSSPILWGHRLFLTAGTMDTTDRLVLCYDADTGRLLWQTKLELEKVPRLYAEAGPAPATPCTDGKRIFVFFEGLGLVALDLDGKVLWTVPLGPFNNVNSLGNSPIIYQDTVILCCDQEGVGFVAAFDAASGAVRWWTPRNLGSQWSTPLLIDYQGRPQLVVTARTVVSYDPATGQELWSCRGLSPNVAPSPVFADGLICATSGRNGPAMAIDPGGHGDVTDTAVRMYYPTGGPYVPSPLVYPLLMLPGDEGHARFLNRRGEVAAELRLTGRFFASPLGAAGRLYWTSQSGATYVLDASKLEAAPPEVKIVAVNSLGEKVLASPAVSRGRLYLRGDKHLFCIAGAAGAGTPEVAAAPPPSFAELQARFEQHPAPTGPEVAVRVQVVEAMAAVHDPRAVPFLVQATLNDPHWDVCEAAAQALGQQGEAAAPALRGLLADRRPFIRIIAAQSLGRLALAAATPELLKTVGEADALSRLAGLQALGEIVRAHPEVAPEAAPALLAGLRDEEATVRAGAAEALGRAQLPAGPEREGAVRALRGALADRSSLVAAAARRVLTETYQVSREVIMEDQVLYGAPRPAPVVAELTAGPVRLKFQDGELRYLYVGDREIIRRVYFGVRDSRWDTVMPEFSRAEVESTPGGFQVRLAARCRNDVADYSWTGEITGTADGTVRFHVTGAANADFNSPRVGLNVLFGSDALAGTAYQTTAAAGQTTAGLFPISLSPTLLTGPWTRLTYRTADGLGVACQFTGAEAGMEDQRNYGDSSYKAYSSLAYNYPRIARGERQEETLTVSVTGAPATAVNSAGPVRVLVGPALPGVVLPTIGPPPAAGEAVAFLQLSEKPEQYRGARSLSLSFNPAAHLSDEDTFMENLTALTDQVVTVRALVPQARLTVGPVSFDSPYPRLEPDARDRGRFAAAWAAAAWMECVRAGAREVSFRGGSAERPVLTALALQAGSPVLQTRVYGQPPLAVRTQAALVKGEEVLWLVNQTAEKQEVLVGGQEHDGAAGLLQRFLAETPAAGPVRGQATADHGVIRLTLEPYEVCEVSFAPSPPSGPPR